MQAAGYTVRVCEDPRRFEADLTSFRPDLVLMDVVLPEMSGHDLARFIRQYERYAALPVVFLTTEARWRRRSGPPKPAPTTTCKSRWCPSFSARP